MDQYVLFTSKENFLLWLLMQILRVNSEHSAPCIWIKIRPKFEMKHCKKFFGLLWYVCEKDATGKF